MRNFRIAAIGSLSLMIGMVTLFGFSSRSSFAQGDLARAQQDTATPAATSSATVTAAATSSTPPSLKSDKYMQDTSLLQQNPKGPFVFAGITVGETTFLDAVSKIKADPRFSDVQQNDKDQQAYWKVKDGDMCCQIAGNREDGRIEAIALRIAPGITVGQVIDKFGEPKYSSPSPYSEQEVAIALVYPEPGLIVWVVPGDAKSKLAADSPVVMVLYIDPKSWPRTEAQATLKGWLGYESYEKYSSATPVLTPRVTPTQ